MITKTFFIIFTFIRFDAASLMPQVVTMKSGHSYPTAAACVHDGKLIRAKFQKAERLALIELKCSDINMDASL